MNSKEITTLIENRVEFLKKKVEALGNSLKNEILEFEKQSKDSGDEIGRISFLLSDGEFFGTVEYNENGRIVIDWKKAVRANAPNVVGLDPEIIRIKLVGGIFLVEIHHKVADGFYSFCKKTLELHKKDFLNGRVNVIGAFQQNNYIHHDRERFTTSGTRICFYRENYFVLKELNNSLEFRFECMNILDVFFGGNEKYLYVQTSSKDGHAYRYLVFDVVSKQKIKEEILEAAYKFEYNDKLYFQYGDEFLIYDLELNFVRKSKFNVKHRLMGFCFCGSMILLYGRDKVTIVPVDVI